MNIIIIGAGDIGLHLASIFSQVDYGIVLINIDQKLENAVRDLDVGIRLGSGTDWRLLEELLSLSPDILIALTDDDEINLTACAIAKNLGYPRTIARVRNPQYLDQTRLNFQQLFYADHLIGPEKLTADAIADMILMPGSIAAEFCPWFDSDAHVENPFSLEQRGNPSRTAGPNKPPPQLMVGLIRRQMSQTLPQSLVNQQIIFPHGHDTLLPGDEVTFIGEREAIASLQSIFRSS